jgi:hypothetical protein
MSSEPPGLTVEVKEEASAPPEDTVIAAEASPAAATPTPAPTGISKELTETLNGVVRRLTEYRDKEEYGPVAHP